MAYKPTTPYTGTLPTGVVKKGSKGNDVKSVQTFLNWCLNVKLTVDGVCGDLTVAQIKNFQTQYQQTYGLKVDGIFGAGSKAAAQKVIDMAKNITKIVNKQVKYGHAVKNENGKQTKGKAGDQGKEVLISTWSYDKTKDKYNHWLYVYRAKAVATRLKLGQAMKDLCNNQHIGYDTQKPDRYSAYDEAEKKKWVISKITKNCETTKADAVAICMRAAGISKKYAPRGYSVRTLTGVLDKNSAFARYRGKAYTQTGEKLQPGDILVSATHMGIVVKSPNVPVLPPPPDPLQKWYDAMVTQFNYSKNQRYNFVTPTVASSKANGTCITFVAVSLQRIGLLPSGAYFYLYPKTMRMSGGNGGASYVQNHSNIFAYSYPNKTIAELWKAGKIKKGDIVGYGNPGYHTMVFMGMNSAGKPLFNTMGHTRGLMIRYPAYENRKVNMLVRIKKI